MKSLLIVLISCFFTAVLFAQDVIFTAEKKSTIVDNLNSGIKANNSGLNASASNVLTNLIDGNYIESNDASKTIIPLLNLLSNGKTLEVRINAALALYRLGNGIGIYRLRGVAIFDDNEKLCKVCKNLYYSYHKLNGTEYLIDF